MGKRICRERGLKMEKERAVLECIDCIHREFCMSVISKLDAVLRELGIIDYALKIFVCHNFNKEGVEREHENRVEEKLKSLDETLNTQ
jgi:hypothetical protein